MNSPAGDASDTGGSPGEGDPVLQVVAARALQQLFDRTVPPPRIGRYTLLEQIGAGGMGVVFAAYDEQLDRKVALKLERKAGASDPRRRRRLLREAQTLARLSHPNVVTVFEAGEYEGQIYLTMEFIRGQTVRAWLDRGAKPWQDALAALLQAGRGLAAAHSAGVVHRDFKPANVLIGEDGRVRVVDFGLAREVPDETAAPDDGGAATAAGALLGTPAYMSPEQFRGAVADARSDQFSFCAVVWEALYGQPAFAADAAGDRRAAVLAGRITPPPALTRVPRRLQRTLTRGLHTDADRRYPSMDALLAALQPGAARRGGSVAAVLLTTGAIAGAYARRDNDDAAAVDRCVRQAEAHLEEVWRPDRRARLAEALAAAPATATHVAAKIAERTAVWKDMSLETCRASLVERSQSDALFDRRMECLRRRLQAVDALLRTLEQADAKVVERAVTASDRLPSASECVPEVLLRDTLAPPDPATAAEVEAVRAALVDVEANMQTGRFTRAVPEAEHAALQARATGHWPVIAEARQMFGAALLARGDIERAEEVLRAALTAAETCGHDRVAARALIGLAEIAGDDREQPRDALERLEVAAAKLARTPDGPVTQATLMRLRATLQWRIGERVAAIESLTRADADATAGLGATDSLVAELRRHLAWMLRMEGRRDEARRVLDELAEVRPEAATREQAAFGDARAELELELELANEALTYAIQAQGERRPRVAGLLTEIGELNLALGRLAAAEDAFTHALQILETPSGNDKTIATANLGLARVALRRGDTAEALRRSRAAHELRRAAYHDVHGQTMAAKLAIGDALRAAGDEEAAQVAYRRVLKWVNNQRLISPEHRALCRGLDLEGSASSAEHAECRREVAAGIARTLARQPMDGPEVVGLHASIYFSVPGLAGRDRHPSVPTALYVVDETTARLRLLGEVREAGVAVAVSAIATDPDGVLHGFVHDLDIGTRFVTLDPRTTTATPIGDGAPIPQILSGAAFDQEGALWVIVQDDKSIREFDLATHALVGDALKLPEAPLIGGGDLAFDRDGVCYFIGAYARSDHTTKTSTPLYTCDLVAGTFTSLGRLTGVGFEDNIERQFSPSGLAFSLREDCTEVSMTSDGHGAEEVARIDLRDMTASATGSTVINLSMFHWLDLAGFSGPHSFPGCADEGGER